MELLLNKQALKGLSEEDQATAKSEALGQFLLGSIFGGQGIASGYQAVQNIVPNIQQQRQQQGLLSEVAKIKEKYFPDEQQETRQALNANLGRDRFASSPYSLSTSLGLPQENVQAQAMGQPIDFNAALRDVGRLSTNPNAAKMLPGLTKALETLQPKVQGDLILNPNQQVIGSLPSQKDLVQTQLNTRTGLFEANPVQNAMRAQIAVAPPKVSPDTMLGISPTGGIVQSAIPGAVTAIEDIESAKARAQAQGQVEQVVGADGRTYFVPRSSLLTQRPSAQTGSATGGVTTGGSVAKVSPAQATLDAATNARFLDFSKNSLDSANTASGRKIAAEQLYDLSTRIDNNKLTGIQAGVYGYMNAIPGLGKLFEQDITDVTRMNQMIKTAQLEKTAMQKGAASNLDATTIEKSYASITDPASSTRMAAAFEVALADKDVAKNQFVESYKGDPGKISTAWQNSPDNKPLFTHPKFNQFLNEQISKNPSAPVLPAGFTLVQGKSGQYGVKRPDGTVMPVGQ
jgi:hypothetical protein